MLLYRSFIDTQEDLVYNFPSPAKETQDTEGRESHESGKAE